MGTRITFEQVCAGYPLIAKAVGRNASVMPRERTRTPEKAALLRMAGISEEQIGPVGARRFFSADGARPLS